VKGKLAALVGGDCFRRPTIAVGERCSGGRYTAIPAIVEALFSYRRAA